jgi:hypothetical protein
MSIGNIVKSAFVGVGIGGVIGAAIGIDDGVIEAAKDTLELIAESSQDLGEIYENAPDDASNLFSVRNKIGDIYPDFQSKIDAAILPQGKEWVNANTYMQSVPDALPALTEDVITNANLTPNDVAGYNYASDNIKDVANIVQDNIDQVAVVNENLGKELGLGAAVGGGLFGAGAAVKDVPQWTEKVAHSINVGGEKAKGK